MSSVTSIAGFCIFLALFIGVFAVGLFKPAKRNSDRQRWAFWSCLVLLLTAISYLGRLQDMFYYLPNNIEFGTETVHAFSHAGLAAMVTYSLFADSASRWLPVLSTFIAFALPAVGVWYPGTPFLVWTAFGSAFVVIFAIQAFVGDNWDTVRKVLSADCSDPRPRFSHLWLRIITPAAFIAYEVVKFLSVPGWNIGNGSYTFTEIAYLILDIIAKAILPFCIFFFTEAADPVPVQALSTVEIEGDSNDSYTGKSNNSEGRRKSAKALSVAGRA